MVGWNGKNVLPVVASGMIASTVAPGVVYCSEKFLPHQITWLKKLLAEHVVLPQLGFFETLSKSVDKAHKKYDLKKREGQKKRGEPVDLIPSYTPQQRAYFISDALVQMGVGLAGDFAATYGQLKLWHKFPNAFNTTLADFSVTLGCVALMPMVFAGFSENVHHGLRKMIQKVTGMNNESADNIALSTTYVGLPGLVGTLAGVVVARR